MRPHTQTDTHLQSQACIHQPTSTHTHIHTCAHTCTSTPKSWGSWAFGGGGNCTEGFPWHWEEAGWAWARAGTMWAGPISAGRSLLLSYSQPPVSYPRSVKTNRWESWPGYLQRVSVQDFPVRAFLDHISNSFWHQRCRSTVYKHWRLQKKWLRRSLK